MQVSSRAHARARARLPALCRLACDRSLHCRAERAAERELLEPPARAAALQLLSKSRRWDSRQYAKVWEIAQLEGETRRRFS